MDSAHRVIVFHKLESFRGAATEVTSQLRQMFDRNVVIEKYSNQHHEFRHTGCTTAVVVIDARQTRSLLTPERRDPNVDHWEEIRMLSQITKPTGSILFVIYGDEGSQKLDEDKLMSPIWLTNWKYNDQLACEVAQKERCFSIWKEFNSKQVDRIREFVKTLPLVPHAKADCSVLQLGKGDSTIIDDALSRYPFTSTEIKHTRLGSMDVQEYKYIDFLQTSTKHTTRYIMPKFPPIHACETSDPMKSLERQLTADAFKDVEVSDEGSSCFGDSKGSIPLFDRVLVSCHCEQCFKIICSYKEEVTNIVKSEFERIGVGLRDCVLPFLNDYQDYEIVGDEVRDLINQVRSGYIDESENKIVDDKAAMFYFWFVFFEKDEQSSSSRHWTERIIDSLRKHNKLLLFIMFIVIAISLYMWFVYPASRDVFADSSKQPIHIVRQVQRQPDAATMSFQNASKH